MKTGSTSMPPAARQDLLSKLLEEGRARQPQATTGGGDDVPAGTGDDSAALKTMVRSCCNVCGLLMLAFSIKVQFPWSGTKGDVAVFVFEVLLCLVLPVWGYAWTAHWDDDDDTTQARRLRNRVRHS